MNPPAELEPGQVLTAEWLNELVRYIRSNSVKVDPRSGLVMNKTSSGTVVGIQDTPEFWAKITYAGAGGAYSWIEVLDVATPSSSAVSWVNGVYKGYVGSDTARPSGVPPDPMFEAGGNDTLPVNYVARVSRDHAGGQLTFRAGKCP